MRNVREADYVFRWGGDEFLVLISWRTRPWPKARPSAAGRPSTRHRDQDLPPGVGLSIGCAEVPFDASDIMALVKIADERMYVNKRRPR